MAQNKKVDVFSDHFFNYWIFYTFRDVGENLPTLRKHNLENGKNLPEQAPASRMGAGRTFSGSIFFSG